MVRVKVRVRVKFGVRVRVRKKFLKNCKMMFKFIKMKENKVVIGLLILSIIVCLIYFLRL